MQSHLITETWNYYRVFLPRKSQDISYCSSLIYKHSHGLISFSQQKLESHPSIDHGFFLLPLHISVQKCFNCEQSCREQCRVPNQERESCIELCTNISYCQVSTMLCYVFATIPLSNYSARSELIISFFLPCRNFFSLMQTPKISLRAFSLTRALLSLRSRTKKKFFFR